MEGSIGSTLTDKTVTRNRRFPRLRFLVVLRNKCRNGDGADKESSIPRSMSRIGCSGSQRRQQSAPGVAVAVGQQAARTAKPSRWWVTGRVSGRFGGHAGLGRHREYWWCESGDIVVAAAAPSRRCCLGALWRDATTRVRRLGSPCCSLDSGVSRCSKCARRCARGK